MNIISNLINNYHLLSKDFVGLQISYIGIGYFFLHVLIALSVFVAFYLFGEKIRKLFFRENKKFNFFVNIALGYITIGTGMGILGVLSLLQKEFIWGYLAIVLLIALYPFSFFGLRKGVLRFFTSFRMTPLFTHGDIVRWVVFLFVLIAFLRLMTPEIGEDGYHTDLPRLYITTHTTMHEARDPLRVIPYPQLAEMTYVLPVFLGDKEAARFIHFGFYLLVIILLFSIAKTKESSFAKFAPLLFVSAPLVIRYAPSSYIDFFMIFCFLLSIVLIEKGSKKQLLLSGIIFGGAIATKLWLIIYLPAILCYIAYLNRRIKWRYIFGMIVIFVASALSVGLIWYVRDYIITGSPIYPVFSKPEYLEASMNMNLTTTSFFGFNWKMFSLSNMVVYSPLFFVATIMLLVKFKEVVGKLKKFPLILLFIFIFLEQLITPNVYLGRHLLAWYTIAIIAASAGIYVALGKSRVMRYGFVGAYCLLFFYYFLNTVLILPYGFGWADRNAYLTRVLGLDNASYYDFDRLFGKWTTDKDLVAIYGIVSYYYADFSYVDVNYIFSKKERDFNLLKKKGATKLLLKGGDIKWFCKTLSLTHCDTNKVKLLATWPEATSKYNLYEIR